MGAPGTQPILGTLAGNSTPILIHTNGKNTSLFSVNNGLGGGTGDGLRIIGGLANYLDMWSDDANTETYVKFHTNGKVEGASHKEAVLPI